MNRDISHFYHLEPIGIGTPYMESLPSYVKRLAEAHSITPGNLLKEIIPSAYRFDEICNPASGLVHTLISLLMNETGVTGLNNLYMGNWNSAYYSSCIFKKSLEWCPICFEECKSLCGQIYEQIIWCFSEVRACQKHGIELVKRCPYCENYVHFGSGSRVGFCNTCSAWLGLSEQMAPQLHFEESGWVAWVNESIGNLVSFGENNEDAFLNMLSNVVFDTRILSYRTWSKGYKIDRLEWLYLMRDIDFKLTSIFTQWDEDNYMLQIEKKEDISKVIGQ